MSQEQNSTISGSIYDVYSPASQEYKENRMPRVGQRCEFEDGRKFVFCSTLENIAAGAVAEARAATEFTSIVGAAPAGTRKVTVSSAGASANVWAGGYLVVELINGVGHTYKIKSNAVSDAITNEVAVTLYDPLVVGLVTATDVTLLPLRNNWVEEGTANCDAVGIAAAATTAGTDGVLNYFWVQTDGIGFALGTVGAAGAGLMPGASGALIATDATGVIVAHGVVAGASNSVVNMCFLS